MPLRTAPIGARLVAAALVACDGSVSGSSNGEPEVIDAAGMSFDVAGPRDGASPPPSDTRAAPQWLLDASESIAAARRLPPGTRPQRAGDGFVTEAAADLIPSAMGLNLTIDHVAWYPSLQAVVSRRLDVACRRGNEGGVAAGDGGPIVAYAIGCPVETPLDVLLHGEVRAVRPDVNGDTWRAMGEMGLAELSAFRWGGRFCVGPRTGEPQCTSEALDVESAPLDLRISWVLQHAGPWTLAVLHHGDSALPELVTLTEDFTVGQTGLTGFPIPGPAAAYSAQNDAFVVVTRSSEGAAVYRQVRRLGHSTTLVDLADIPSDTFDDLGGAALLRAGRRLSVLDLATHEARTLSGRAVTVARSPEGAIAVAEWADLGSGRQTREPPAPELARLSWRLLAPPGWNQAVWESGETLVSHAAFAGETLVLVGPVEPGGAASALEDVPIPSSRVAIVRDGLYEILGYTPRPISRLFSAGGVPFAVDASSGDVFELDLAERSLRGPVTTLPASAGPLEVDARGSCTVLMGQGATSDIVCR